MEKGNLVITRNKGQSLIIGDDEIKISLLWARSGQAKFLICANKDIPVHREEVYERIKEEDGIVQSIKNV